MKDITPECGAPEYCRDEDEVVSENSCFLARNYGILNKDPYEAMRIALCMAFNSSVQTENRCPMIAVFKERFNATGQRDLPGEDYFDYRKLEKILIIDMKVDVS